MEPIDVSQRIFYSILAVIIVGAVFLLGELAYQFSNLPENAPGQMQVSGMGKVYAKPDIATINFGVHSEAATSQDTVDQNNKTMNAVIMAVKNLGVSEKDIQTSQYNLSPLYDYTEKGGRTFKGYSLDQQVTVKIRDFSKISDILSAASSNGANTIGDLQFTIDDIEKVRAEARDQAIAQAKEKAQSLFAAAGVHAEKIINIEESQASVPQPIYYGLGAGGAMAQSATAPQIQTGQNEVDSTVTLTYRVK